MCWEKPTCAPPHPLEVSPALPLILKVSTFVKLMTALSHPFKQDRQVLPISTPISSRQSMVRCPLLSLHVHQDCHWHNIDKPSRRYTFTPKALYICLPARTSSSQFHVQCMLTTKYYEWMNNSWNNTRSTKNHSLLQFSITDKNLKSTNAVHEHHLHSTTLFPAPISSVHINKSLGGTSHLNSCKQLWTRSGNACRC